MFKLDLEKAEEPEIKLPTSVGSSKKQESSRKNIYFCFIDYAKAFDCVDHNKLENSSRDGNTRPPYLPPEKLLYATQEATIKTRHGTRDWFKIGKGVHHGYILVPCLFNLYVECTLKNVRLDDSQTELTSSQFFNRDQSLCLPIVSASLDLSASIIYYGLEGVILWGSITVQSVP